MLNDIRLIDGRKLVESIGKVGRHHLWLLDDGNKIASKDIGPVELLCVKCKHWHRIGSLYNGRDKSLYQCHSCKSSGENNPFYGKKHSDKTKEIISTKATGRNIGELNGFFGKHHSEETKAILRKKCPHIGANNGFFGKTHRSETVDTIRRKNIEHRKSLTTADLNEIRRKQKIGHANAMTRDPVGYRKAKINASRISLMNQRRFKINKIESKVQEILKENELEFEYSVILGFKQFDFGNKDNRLLIEVHGDYWHSNPSIYGPGKRPLNEIQKTKIIVDAEKHEWAKSHGYTVVVVWEKELLENNNRWLEEVLDAYKIRTDRN
jgi:very-short-patch-repair endonuclease